MTISIKTILEALLEQRRASIYNSYYSNLESNQKKVREMTELAITTTLNEIETRPSREDETITEYVSSITGFTRFSTREECEAAASSKMLSEYNLRNFAERTEGITTLPHMEDTSYYGKMHVRDMITDATTLERMGYTRKFSTPAQLAIIAESRTEAALASFVYKMSRKLGSMGEVSEATVDDQWKDLFTTRLIVKYQNGITFNLINSIVFKTSKRGVYFCQFPARFNDVCSNGVYAKGSQSEAGVKKIAKELAEGTTV